MNLPNSINCRLSSDASDLDIKVDLAQRTDKTARVKELYRLGLQFEAMKRDTRMIPTAYTGEMYRYWINELRKKNPELLKV